MVKFAGFPLSAWAFALRTWAAMVLALYVAFWLQLESASSAAVTVGILSLQTRGRPTKRPSTGFSRPSSGLSPRSCSQVYFRRVASYS